MPNSITSLTNALAPVKALYGYFSRTLSSFAVTDAIERNKNNATQFAVSELYDKTQNSNIAISRVLTPQGSVSTLAVVTGNKHNILQVTSYGEMAHPDIEARQPLVAIKKMAGTENIINMDTALSIEHRKKIKPFLTETKSLLEAYKISKVFFNNIMKEHDTTISFQDTITYFTTNVIGLCVFGLPFVTLAQAKLIRRAGLAIAESESNSIQFDKTCVEMANLNNEMLSTHKDIILNTDNYIKEKADLTGKESDAEILEKIKATKGISNLLVEANLSTLIMGGIAYVQSLKEIKARLREEINCQTEINLEILRKLPYLHLVYKETLRIMSPTAFIARQTSKPTEIQIYDDKGSLNKHSLPANSLLFAPIRRIHHDNKFWQDPETFNPSRFENPEVNEHFIPFSIGQRSCPAASNFNEIVFKTALVESLKYNVEFDKAIETIKPDALSSRWSQEYYIKHLIEVDRHAELSQVKLKL